MTAADFSIRYGRQIALRDVGEAGQLKLLQSHVFIVGLGGLGSPAAMYLAAAGVGRLTLCDFDMVEESNLARQIMHRHAAVGELKTASAAATLRAINPAVELELQPYAAAMDDLDAAVAAADAVADCADNFATRIAINRAAIKTATPWVSGAAIRWEGQVTSFDPRAAASPCYRCLYPEADLAGEDCSRAGIISPLVGVVGAMQALEIVHILLNRGRLPGRVWLLDGQTMEWQRMKLAKNPNCPACKK